MCSYLLLPVTLVFMVAGLVARLVLPRRLVLGVERRSLAVPLAHLRTAVRVATTVQVGAALWVPVAVDE